MISAMGYGIQGQGHNELGSTGFNNPKLQVISNNPAASQQRREGRAAQVTSNPVQTWAPPNDPVACFVGGYVGNTGAAI